MTAKEKADELIKKFGSESLDILNETISIWETKLKYAIGDNHERGISICLSTINYWKNIYKIIKQQLVVSDGDKHK